MGNPFIHVELATDDVGAAKKFYKTLFDWKLSDTPEMGGYTMLDAGKGVGGGMMKKSMAEQPTAWLPYVTVGDVKKSLAKVLGAGGRVVVDYTPIGKMGAIGVFVDPAGAALGLWEMGKPEKKAATPKKKAAAPKKKAAAAKKPAKTGKR
jgi:predicted enzyme related to lactoylglutathione lyase